MTWAIIAAMALASIAAAILMFKLPKNSWSLLGVAILLGLAGYTWQGSPAQPSATRSGPIAVGGEQGWQLVELRKAFAPNDGAPQARELITADALVRQGQFSNAAMLLRGAVRKNPQDSESWLAMANALVEHADGSLTPAALYAYRMANQADPQAGGPGFFMGLAMIREGKLIEGRELWVDRLNRAPADAPWRPQMEDRLGRLDQLLRQIVAEAGASSQ